jgi:hypothetical protein
VRPLDSVAFKGNTQVLASIERHAQCHRESLR